jgi:hypothetical protein
MSKDVERGHARSERSLYAAVFLILVFGLLAVFLPVPRGASDPNPTAAAEWPLWQD